MEVRMNGRKSTDSREEVLTGCYMSVANRACKEGGEYRSRECRERERGDNREIDPQVILCLSSNLSSFYVGLCWANEAYLCPRHS